MVSVLPVVGRIDVEVAVSARDGVSPTRRSVDKEVVGDVDPRLSLRVASHEVASVLPVIDDAVDVLACSLHLIVTRGVVAIEIAVKRDGVALNQSSCRVGKQSLPYHTVGERDVLRCLAFVVPVDGEGFVESPGEGAVIKNHVDAVCHSSRILSRRTAFSHAELHVADDDVVGCGEGHSVAIDDDALSRCGLSSHVEVGSEGHSRADVDDSRHVEHHDSVRLAHCIAQRARPAVIEVGHMIY